MTRFLDGPAAGVTLMLRRAPLYLRAVRGAAGDWDALDQLADAPKADEAVVVYRRSSGPMNMHIRARSGGGFYQGGEYRVLEPQPADEAMRSTSAWRAWVSEQVGQPVGEDGAVAP